MHISEAKSEALGPEPRSDYAIPMQTYIVDGTCCNLIYKLGTLMQVLRRVFPLLKSFKFNATNDIHPRGAAHPVHSNIPLVVPVIWEGAVLP